jgi:hypothetical protein
LFTCIVKATIEVPDELYRRVKAKSALEGRAIRDVTADLFRRYVGEKEPPAGGPAGPPTERVLLVDGKPAPVWFGALRDYARRVKRHDLEAIRASIARGIVGERDL